MITHQLKRIGSTWYGSEYQCTNCNKTATTTDASINGMGVSMEQIKADLLSQIDDIQKEADRKMGWCSALDEKEGDE